MIRFSHVQKWYGKLHVLKDIDLQVDRGTICLMCGKSGAGKSTLLAAANGIEPIDEGEISIDGVRLGAKGADLRKLRTQIGVVYQSDNLFGHLTVERNMRLGLEKALGLPKSESEQRARHYLEEVGLSHKWGAYPAELSGGEQQRVAIARCLAMHPKVMLLDEPTSALDAENARDVVDTIHLLAREGITILLSTHLVASFADIAHCYLCMEDGRIVERGKLSDGAADSCSKLAALMHLGPRSREEAPAPLAVVPVSGAASSG